MVWNQCDPRLTRTMKNTVTTEQCSGATYVRLTWVWFYLTFLNGTMSKQVTLSLWGRRSQGNKFRSYSWQVKTKGTALVLGKALGLLSCKDNPGFCSSGLLSVHLLLCGSEEELCETSQWMLWSLGQVIDNGKSGVSSGIMNIEITHLSL